MQGMYAYGRYQYRRKVTAEGEIEKRVQAVAYARVDDPFVGASRGIHHVGRVLEDLKNRERLEKNRTNGEATVLSGRARVGLALFQGLLLCGHCGRAITVRYRGNGGIYPIYE